jgi:dsRNA-specific ribonuclease
LFLSLPGQKTYHKEIVTDDACAMFAALSGLGLYHKQALFEEQTLGYIAETFRMYVGALYSQLGYTATIRELRPLMLVWSTPLVERARWFVTYMENLADEIRRLRNRKRTKVQRKQAD